jgi:hypothetical protein
VAGLFNWGARKPDVATTAPAAAPPEPAVTPSKVFPKFLTILAHQPAPTLVDVGGVVGANVAFFGDRLSCKLIVEDLVAIVEAHAKRPGPDGLAAAFNKQLAAVGSESVDGVLCWDLFDYLDRATGQALASRLVAILKPGGALYGFFGTTAAELTHYTRFVVQGPDSFRQRAYPATPTRRHVLLTRDISRMFEGLTVSDSVLLKTGARETLFRKAGPTG